MQPPTKTASRLKRARSWAVQQVVTPRDGPAQGALSLGDIAGAARQERQAPVEPGEDRRRIEELDPGRGQLDGEGEAVEADADGGDRRRVPSIKLEVGAHGTRALDEERDRIEPGERLEWRQVARVGDAQRRDRILLLAPEVKDLAARRKDGQAGRGPEEPTHHRCAVHDLLEVVGDEQQVQIPQVRLKELDDWPLRVFAEADGLGDGRRDQARIADRSEFHEEGAARIFRSELLGNAKAEPCLAGPAGARQRHQPRTPHEVADFIDLSLAADEARHLGRQVGRSVKRARRREVVGQTRTGELRQALGLVEILEPELAEFAQSQISRQRVLHEGRRRRREEDLAAVGGSRDPRGPMDVEANVVLPAQDALTRVEPHSNADRARACGPGLRRKGALCGDRRRDCRYGALEDDEECVSLGGDLDPTGLPDRSTHDGVVAFDERSERRAQGSHEAGRPLDVREEERQRPDGEGTSA